MLIETKNLQNVLDNGTRDEIMHLLQNTVIPPFFVPKVIERGNHQEIMALISNKFTDLVAAAYPIILRGNHQEIMYLLRRLPNDRMVGVARIILRGNHLEIMRCIKKWGSCFYKLDEELLYERNNPQEIAAYEKQKTKNYALQ